MRERFYQNNELDVIRIEDVEITTKSRHELPPLLLALQHLYVTPELNKAIFNVLDKRLGNSKRGRRGMSHWEILVLGTVRLNMNMDYDHLLDSANNHDSLRGILGVKTRIVFKDKKEYKLQTLKDNVSLLDEELLSQINDIVVKTGHQLLKKNEEEEKLELKADTFPVSKNIHFPTDINLLWDSGRKCLDYIVQLSGIAPMEGLRQSRSLRKKLKSSYLTASNIHRKKGLKYEQRLRVAVEKYLSYSRNLLHKIKKNEEGLDTNVLTLEQLVLWEELSYYSAMLEKHIDLVNRRLLKGEKIPHHEKIFSIFEPETEWINKGKQHKNVDLGHNTLICTDQYNFIVSYKVAIGQTDKGLAIPLKDDLLEKFGFERLKSISFDRGFYSSKAKAELQESFDKVIMPKSGKKSKKLILEETEPEYVILRNKHSAVESNINELQHAGINVVRDKGTEAFKRYVALGVLAYNLKRLGKVLIKKKQKESSLSVTTSKKYKKAA